MKGEKVYAERRRRVRRVTGDHNSETAIGSLASGDTNSNHGYQCRIYPDLAAKSFVLDGQVVGTPGMGFTYSAWKYGSAAQVK
jgi:hypothetical protein